MKQSQPVNLGNNIQHHWQPGKCKEKSQCDPISPWSKKPGNSKGWRGCGQTGSQHWDVTRLETVEISMKVTLEKAKNGPSCDRPGSFPKTPLFTPCIFVEFYSLNIVVIYRHEKIPWRGVKCPDLIITALIYHFTAPAANASHLTFQGYSCPGTSQCGCRQTNHAGNEAEGTVVLFGNQP